MYKFVSVGGLVLLLASVPASMLLPPSIAFENGPIENLQVILLLASALWSIRLSRTLYDKGVQGFDLFCALLFVLLAARELSWGRVFYRIDFDETGPSFVSMSDYVWRTEAYTFIVLIGLAMLILLVRDVPLRRLAQVPLPLSIFAIIFAGVLLQYAGEHGLLLGKLNGQTLEELNETIVYAMQPLLCSYYHERLQL